MAIDMFVGLPEAELLTIRARAQALIGGVKTIMSYSDVGSSVSKQFAEPPGAIVDACNYALRKINPGDYGSERKTRRVHSSFRGNVPL